MRDFLYYVSSLLLLRCGCKNSRYVSWGSIEKALQVSLVLIYIECGVKCHKCESYKNTEELCDVVGVCFMH